ncbi:MAG: fibronectin type III domain-containing protein [Chthoniobacter sp.]|nr:fibronectin type III domain-containing protein [Chthoniobacter sp.]
MAQNPIPVTYDPLVALAEDAADGAHQYQAAIGLLHNTETAIRADITALTTAETDLLAKRVEKNGVATNLRTADSNAKAFIALFVRTGRVTIGSDWNAQWEQAGFSAGSLAIPRMQEERFVLLGAMRDFLTTNPSLESVDANHPALNVTAALATTHYDTISTARSNVNVVNAQNGFALAARDAAQAALRKRLTGLREELIQILADDDPRWYGFGFNRPADPATPGVPEGVVVTPGAVGSGAVIVDWNDARRATGYKVFALLAGAATPRQFGLFSDTQTVIPLTTGDVAQITVVAHNDHGYSEPSTAVPATAP